MEFSVGVSSAWKKIFVWKVGVSSAWKKITRGDVGVSGAWKQFYGPAIPTDIIHMYKDSGDVPSGATRLSSYDGKFPRMTVTSGDIGSTGGNNGHNGSAHGAWSGNTSTVSHSQNWYRCTFLCYGYECEDSGHNHSAGHTLSASDAGTNNLPEYFDVLAYTHTHFGPNALFLFHGSSIPSGWTEYTDNAIRYIRFYSTALTTGGSYDHTHSYTGVSGQYLGPTIDHSNNREDYLYYHTMNIDHSHTYTGLVPPYMAMKLIYRNETVRSLDELPSGVVLLRTNATVPSGWSAYSAGATYLARHTTETGGTGGSGSHNHASGSFSTSGYNWGTYREGNSDGTNGYSINYGAHTYDHGHTTDADNWPPWVYLYAIKKD